MLYSLCTPFGALFRGIGSGGPNTPLNAAQVSVQKPSKTAYSWNIPLFRDPLLDPYFPAMPKYRLTDALIWRTPKYPYLGCFGAMRGSEKLTV